MHDTENNTSNLPAKTVESTAKPGADAKTIVALVKSGGRITGYKLSDGRLLNKEEGVQLAKQGGIQGVGVSRRNGNEYLKALPDQSQNNNLGNLPSVTQ